MIDLASEVVDRLNCIRREEERKRRREKMKPSDLGPGGVEDRKGCDCPPRSDA